jgi:uncharacterized membrane-anchored protein YhcB (DUF1043 family)
MNRQTVWLEAQQRNFAVTPNGVQWEAVIFSSEFNRNKYFFDIYKLKRWANKLEKVLLNNNHDGKYFANSTDKIVSINVTTDDNGVTECFAVVESTNAEKKANPEMVTGFSLELAVDEKDVIANENGEYYPDYEWIGMAYLNGILAGSGDSRILSTKTFSQANQTNIMNEDQIKALLEAQKTELVKEFKASLETATESITAKVFEHLESQKPEVVESISQPEPEIVEPPVEVAESTDPEPTETVETQEEDPTLKVIENQLNHAENLKNQMKQFSSEELVNEVAPALNTTEKSNVTGFLSKFR